MGVTSLPWHLKPALTTWVERQRHPVAAGLYANLPWGGSSPTWFLGPLLSSLTERETLFTCGISFALV